MPALNFATEDSMPSSSNLNLNMADAAFDVSPADSKDHVKIIRAQNYGGGGHVIGNAHKGLIGGVGGGGGGYGHGGGGYGGGHGGGGSHFVYTQSDDDCPSGVNPILGLALLAGVAAAAAVLIVQITMGAGRKRRRRGAGPAGALTDDDEDIHEQLVDRAINLMALGESRLRSVRGGLGDCNL